MLLCGHMQPHSTTLWHSGIHSSPVTSSLESLVSCDPCHYWDLFRALSHRHTRLFSLHLPCVLPCLGWKSLEGVEVGAHCFPAYTLRHSLACTCFSALSRESRAGGGGGECHWRTFILIAVCQTNPKPIL